MADGAQLAGRAVAAAVAPRLTVLAVAAVAGVRRFDDQIDQWLAAPREFLPGNRMAFAGIPDEADRRDLIAYLKVETGYAPD